MARGDFAIVGEGITDQIVIKNVIWGFFDQWEDDPEVVFEQPPNDATATARDLQKARDKGEVPPGGWTLVIQYLEQKKYLQALQTCRYLVIQIDTDVAEEYGVRRTTDSGPLTAPNACLDRVWLGPRAHRCVGRPCVTPSSAAASLLALGPMPFAILRSIQAFSAVSGEALVDAVITDLRRRIDPAIAAEHGHRFLFAIGVDEIECWLLGLVFDRSKPAKLRKTTGCLEALHHERKRQRRAPLLKADSKDPAAYLELSRDLQKSSVLRQIAAHNSGLTSFLAQLARVEPRTDD